MHPIRGGKKDEVIFLLLRQEYTYKVNYLSCYKSRPRLGDAGPSTRGLFSFVDQLLYLKRTYRVETTIFVKTHTNHGKKFV